MEVPMKWASSLVVVATSLVGLSAATLTQAAQPLPAPKAGVALDYEFFKTRVQPVFLTKREGHGRCYVCHSNNNARFHLVMLSPGATMWNEDQSKQNFELIKRVAVPGSIDSPIVMHPLDEKAGGHPHHGGGQQFESQSDPAWQTLKSFVMGEKVASR
jgi:hypothetical protein